MCHTAGSQGPAPLHRGRGHQSRFQSASEHSVPRPVAMALGHWPKLVVIHSRDFNKCATKGQYER